MSNPEQEPVDEAQERVAPRGWADRITFAGDAEPIAFARGEVIVTRPAVRRTQELIRELRLGNADQNGAPLGGGDREGGRRDPLSRFLVFDGISDPLLLVRELRSEGFQAQLNHVFFAHCSEDCCGPHPAMAGVQGSPVYATPVYATPVYATPVYATPVYATPVYATPVYATPVYATGADKATGVRRSSVRPVAEAEATAIMDAISGQDVNQEAEWPLVVVIDNGRAAAGHRSPHLEPVNPVIGTADDADDRPDSNGDHQIDAAAGHGEFIAGLVRSQAPGSAVVVLDALEPEGDGNEKAIATMIDNLPVQPGGAVLNLSFGGYVLDDEALLLATAIRDAQARGWVVVASAGNDGICRKTYPAALPDVVSVGAIGPYGPAPFTNYGPWVRACAPGVDVISTFFTDYVGDPEMGPMTGWAKWSGTSFSAPIVAGAIAQEMLARQVSATEAVTRLIDAEGLLRLRGLGTVINQV